MWSGSPNGQVQVSGSGFIPIENQPREKKGRRMLTREEIHVLEGRWQPECRTRRQLDEQEMTSPSLLAKRFVCKVLVI